MDSNFLVPCVFTLVFDRDSKIDLYPWVPIAIPDPPDRMSQEAFGNLLAAIRWNYKRRDFDLSGLDRPETP